MSSDDLAIPADIAAAINQYRHAVKVCARAPVLGNYDAEGVAYRALNAVILKHLSSRGGKEVIVPWSFGGEDCLHPQGFEAECECIGCPRKAGQ